MNGYNFTEHVRKSLALARDEAVGLHAEYVGTEHILLGILSAGHNVATTILANLGVDPQQLRDAVLQLITPARSPRSVRADLPYTSRAKHVLEQAMAEARELNHSYVGTEHALLGLLREGKGIAAQALETLGVTREAARAEMLSLLGTEPPPERPKRRQNAHLVTSPARVRAIVANAYQLATDRSSRIVTPMHLAVALFEHREGAANTALQRLQFDADKAIAALEPLLPRGTAPLIPEVMIEPSPECIQVMERMDSIANETETTVGTHHLLIALLRHSPEVASALESQNIAAGDVAIEMSRITG